MKFFSLEMSDMTAAAEPAFLKTFGRVCAAQEAGDAKTFQRELTRLGKELADYGSPEMLNAANSLLRL